jgi:predicted nucleic acid-binding protein
VVDASVAVKWFVPEVHSSDALRLLSEPYELLAPDLIVAEVVNVLWKRQRCGELRLHEPRGILRDFLRVNVAVRPITAFIGIALDIAVRRGLTVYDALYLALAVTRRCQMVTADRKLYGATRRERLASLVLWIADVPTVAGPASPH